MNRLLEKTCPQMIYWQRRKTKLKMSSMTKANFFALYIMLVINMIVTVGAFAAGQTEVGVITSGFVVLMAGLLMFRRKQARAAAQSDPSESPDSAE